MKRAPGYSGDAAILDRGVTLAFRIRLSTAATGPIDRIYPETGPAGGPPLPWPEDGYGWPVANNGRSMFTLTQVGLVFPPETEPVEMRESYAGVARKGFSEDEEESTHDGPDY
jgi:hypothetical protein